MADADLTDFFNADTDDGTCNGTAPHRTDIGVAVGSGVQDTSSSRKGSLNRGAEPSSAAAPRPPRQSGKLCSRHNLLIFLPIYFATFTQAILISIIVPFFPVYAESQVRTDLPVPYTDTLSTVQATCATETHNQLRSADRASINAEKPGLMIHITSLLLLYLCY
jgi:hypothetical protein